MSFLFGSLLTFGLPLVALPLVIHLINLRRHRRIQWAAMDFLLESQKRNRKWIVLKQLLLLAARTVAILLVVMMLAGPVVRSGWAGLFGRGTTHHLILLDDSYSMSDRWSDSSAFTEGKRAIAQILAQARGRGERQTVSILKFSEASKLAVGDSPAIDRRPLDEKLMIELERLFADLEPSESAAGPVEVLNATAMLPEPGADETRLAYLISDFRKPQWRNAADVRQRLQRLRDSVANLLLVGCAYETRSNLGIKRLAPEAGIRAAGVETWMEVAVANYADEPASAVTVNMEQDGATLPVVEFDQIPPRDEATRRFRVAFADPGGHSLKATLESDAVEADNSRYFAAQIPAVFPVLLVDGSERGDDGYFLRAALNPAGKSLTGWTVRVEPPGFLRGRESLDEFAVVCLLDVPRLDEPETAVLESYVQSGGGLAVFLGPRAQRGFYNERLYRGEEGLLPAPLDVPAQLLRDTQGLPDVKVTDHPVFRVFAGQQNSFLQVAKFDFYYALDPDWTPAADGVVRTIARLRNGAPLVLEKQYGEGRVVVQLSKLSPVATELGVWSNWSINPVFPVYANELVGYLSAARRRFDDRTTDDPIRLEIPEAEYQQRVTVRAPGDADNAGVALTPTAKEGNYAAVAPQPPRSGVWEFQLTTRDGKEQKQLVAVNVPAAEGDLTRVDREELAALLPGVDYDFALAAEFAAADDQIEGSGLGDAFLFALIGALLIEQFLAVSASYHPNPRGAAA